MSVKNNIPGNKAPSFIETQGNFLGHPKGLIILFLTEMWERFSYYGLRAILVLFLTDKTLDSGGYGWENEKALLLLGIYTAMVYIMAIPGGILADKVLGQRKAVMYGGFTLVVGHFLMAVPTLTTFYIALFLIVCGTGLLKPNISTLVGGLYRQGDPRRDSGFTIFYMGINVGALMASLIVGYVGERIGWHWGFSLAGFGMLLGQLIFITGRKYLAHVQDIERPVNKIFTKEDTSPKASTKGFSKKERDQLTAIALSFLIVLIFFASFEQASGLMNLYAFDYTDRFVLGWEVPASWMQGLNSFFIITFGPLMAWLWIYLAKRNKNLSSIFKMGLGSAVLGIGFIFMVAASFERTGAADGKSALYWVVLAYLFHTLGELALSPVSLSFITKVAPRRIVASMMGLYFAVIGFGNFLASLIGIWAQKQGELQIFIGIAVVTISAGCLLMLLADRINKLTHGAEDETKEETDAQTGQLLEAEAS